MIIRKLFRVEGSHVVRDCTSQRCSLSLHGHSAVIEVFFTADGVDNGQMLMDFGLMKGTIGNFIDSFDHCHVMWSKEKLEDREFFKNYNVRWIELPCSPSAEMLSLMLFYVIDKIIENTYFNNGEKGVQLSSVRYHETVTGYAESFREDLKYWNWTLDNILISEPIKEEWKDPLMWIKLMEGEKFINPVIELKYK